MIANLSAQKIEELLQSQVIGRIGCLSGQTVYVVPISYAYDGKCIYCHSYEGKKLQIMRKNPDVCFQVDRMKNMANWESVIAWGDFEEITDKSGIRNAINILLERRLPPISSITTHLGETWPFPGDNGDLDNIQGVFFRICLTQKTGKFETESESLVAYY